MYDLVLTHGFILLWRILSCASICHEVAVLNCRLVTLLRNDSEDMLFKGLKVLHGNRTQSRYKCGFMAGRPSTLSVYYVLPSEYQLHQYHSM